MVIISQPRRQVAVEVHLKFCSGPGILQNGYKSRGTWAVGVYTIMHKMLFYFGRIIQGEALAPLAWVLPLKGKQAAEGIAH